MPPSDVEEEVVRAAGDGGGHAAAKIVAGIEDAIRQVGVLADVRAERARLRLRSTLTRLQAALLVGAAMLFLVAAGTVLVVIGTVGALRAIFTGYPGVGDLVAGGVLLAGPIAWGIVRRVRSDRAELRRLEAKFGEPAGDGERDAHAQPSPQR